jgi:predicted TIM-barrel enzyme/predicted NAD-dependent protein-ADP-ribosyltransferase YbiA (DUF1768 family)
MTPKLPESKSSILLPVIHTLDVRQALENTQIAIDAGADGVMLNNHPSAHLESCTHWAYSMNSSKELVDTFVVAIKNEFPWLFVGVNDLNHYKNPAPIFANAIGCNAVWADVPGIDALHQEHIADEVKAAQNHHGWKWMYMWGVNFKYVNSPELSEVELERAKDRLQAYVDIIVTTWSATGSSPDVEKMKMFARIFGRDTMALASGVTPENYRQYQEYAKIFMVATGIQQNTWDREKDFHYLDPQKTTNLAAQMTSYNIHQVAAHQQGQKISTELAEWLSDSLITNISYNPHDHSSLASKMSNLYPSPFILDGVEYASVEGFWVSLKFPPTDPRRDEARTMSGVAAKYFGAAMKGNPYIYYHGKEISAGSPEHHALMARALRAKCEQNPEVADSLIASGDRAIVHAPVMLDWKLYPDSMTIPGYVFAQVVGDLREELGGGESKLVRDC